MIPFCSRVSLLTYCVHLSLQIWVQGDLRGLWVALGVDHERLGSQLPAGKWIVLHHRRPHRRPRPAAAVACPALPAASEGTAAFSALSMGTTIAFAHLRRI